jgi:hypothetical protein
VIYDEIKKRHVNFVIDQRISCSVVSNSGSEHWRALEGVMRYLVGTMNYGIHYF